MSTTVTLTTQSNSQEVASAVSKPMPCADVVSLRYAALRPS